MELMNNLSFIEAASEQLISSKCCSYNSHEIYTQAIKHNLHCQTLQITSTHPPHPKPQRFPIFFIHNKPTLQPQPQPLPCIVYLHGLSSYCLEAQYLFPYLPGQYDLCMYDLRGHGKNRCQGVTYGIREAVDLYEVVIALRGQGVKEVCLWGRSMGASTILNFMNNLTVDSEVREMIKFVVLDSPFASFEQIGRQTIGKNLGVPAFLCSPLINLAITKIHQKHNLNLKSLDFSQLHLVRFPAAFIYSSNDEVVGCSHSEKIMKGYGGKIWRLEGNFSHNQPRPAQITREAIALLGGWRGKKGRQVSEVVRPNVQRKGLSISLISYKNIKEEQKQNKTPPRPQNHRRSPSPSPVALGHTPSSKHLKKPPQIEQSTMAYTIRQQLQRQPLKHTRSSQQVLQPADRSKSKHKLKTKTMSKQPFLTNRIYM